MFEKYRQHIEFLEQLTPGVDADAAAMQQTDNDVYAERIADSIAELIREDYDFDITDETSPRDDASADTQVFDKVPAAPTVHHVSISDDLTEDAPVPAKETAPDAEDADALFEALAAELGEENL